MLTVSVPYHLDERLDRFDPGPVDAEVTATLPAGGPWQRMAALYDPVAELVAGAGDAPVLVLSGDCTTSLGVLAGLQRRGPDPGIVWFDAHADFHTEASTTSGYLGGMPLALAVGVGTPTLPGLLGLRPAPAAVLVDARDTDPPEVELLRGATVAVRPVDGLGELPDGPLYLHLDLDVCDAGEIPDLLYPVPGGPALGQVLAAVRAVVATGQVAAVGMALTWRAGGSGARRQREVLDAFRTALG